MDKHTTIEQNVPPISTAEKIDLEKAIFKGNQHSAPLSIIDNEPKQNTLKNLINEE